MTRPSTRRISAAAIAYRRLAASLIGALAVLATQHVWAADTGPIKIAVFDFELKDASAGGGVLGRDAIDDENLKASTDEARRMLLASGRYSLVDTGGVAVEVKAAGGLQQCGGCEGALAAKLGADQAMMGVVTRVTRTEYALQIIVRDAKTGTIASSDFTDLRMGANYSWPRAVKWLMDNKLLAAQRAK